MSLADQWSNPGPSPDPIPHRSAPAPKGWEPGVRFDPSGVQVLTTDAVPYTGDPQGADGTRLAADMGLEVPPGYVARLVEAKYDPGAWARDKDDRGKPHTAYRSPVWRFRFVLEPDLHEANIDELVDEISSHRPAKVKAPKGKHAWMCATGDLQLGKGDAGGSPQTIRQFLASTDAAERRFREIRDGLGRSVGTIMLPWLGDCIEGIVSQGGRLLPRLDLPVTKQVTAYQRLMLHQIKTFAPHARRLVVPVIPGNHDEALRVGDQMASTYDDSWAIQGAAAVRMALDMNPEAYRHVSFVFPGHDELTITLDVSGTVTTFAHGHQWAGGKDAPLAWWANQAHGRQQPGEATLMMSAHLHHYRAVQDGIKTWMQTPALEPASTHFRHRQGKQSSPGMLTALVGKGLGTRGRLPHGEEFYAGWSDLQLV